MNLKSIYKFSKGKLSGESTGHDWSHALRVEKNALKIMPAGLSRSEKEIIKAASWLHDTIDPKLSDARRTSISDIKLELKKAHASSKEIDEILYIIQNLSYSKNLERSRSLSLVGQIVQDADRLDALGAIGIARTFYYGGSKDHVLYNEKNARRKNELTEENYREQDSIINHFHEKLLFLKDAMNTPLAKEIADKRTIFMEEFLVQFNEEIGFKNNPNNF